MLKYFLTLYLLLYLIQTFAQSQVIAKNGFEQKDQWMIDHLSTPPCTNEDDNWNYSKSLDGIQPSEGEYFWGIQDLNGNCGSSSFEYIEFAEVNLEDWINVNLSFEIQIKGYDNGDDMKYQLWLDDAAQTEVLFIEGSSDLFTDGWEKVQISIPNSVSRLKLRISVKQNGSDTAGLDKVELIGDLKTYCQELMISEYIEGSSSLNHRNNYLELYNPSDQEINLANYKLVKYTGSDLDFSSNLTLSGFIKPFGTFLVEDNQENLQVIADISSNSAVMNYNGDDKIALIKNNGIIDLIGHIGDSINFAKDVTLRRKSSVQSANNQFDAAEWDTYPLESISDLNMHANYCLGELSEIEITGNDRTIQDGKNTSSMLDNTYFGVWPSAKDTVITRSFIIKNLGNKPLDIEDINISGEGAQYFTTDLSTPVSLSVMDSTIMTFSYWPREIGLNTATISITNDDPSEGIYDFIVQGESSGPGAYPLIISQYYEGKANNKWIEITNISLNTIAENSYYLALYWNNDVFQPIGRKPSRKKLIPSMDPGETIKYCATLVVDQPEYALDGNEIKTSACSFTGDDIIIISRSGDESCWADRIDMIGRQGIWGTDISFIRKYGCQSALPNTGFDPSEWISFSINDIDNAAEETNERLGIHNLGPTIWKNGIWTGGKPDLKRACIIEDDYNTATDGNLNSCNLSISESATLTIAEDNFIRIKNNLSVDGVLEIKNRGTVLMESDSGRVDNNGDIKVFKRATDLKPYDYTYWSSPVQISFLESVFKDSPPNTFFTFSAESFVDKDLDGLDDDHMAWVTALGAMEVGRGYTSMTPNTVPFRNFQEVVFTGILNNGIIEIPLGVQNEIYDHQHHWNLIGNPYASPIDIEKIYIDPRNQNMISGTIYFWTHETAADVNVSKENQAYSSDDYAMYNIGTGGIKASADGRIPTQYISSCQGFFIEALKPGKLYLNNTMRTLENSDIFFKQKTRKSEKQEKRIWLNLSNDNGAYSQILIGFISGATTEYDLQYDGHRLESNNYLSFYSLLKGYQLAIQGLPNLDESMMIPLGFQNKIPFKTSLNMSVDQLQGDFSNTQIILRDNLMSKQHDLKLSPYTFEIDNPGKIHDRFELIFSSEFNVNTEIVTESPKVKWNLFHDQLVVRTSNNDLIKRLEIFDLNGRIIKSLNPLSTAVKTSWYGYPKRAIYILRVLLEDSRILTSKILP